MKRFASSAIAVACLAAMGSATIWGLKSRGTTQPSLPPTHFFFFQEDGSGFTDVGNVTLVGESVDADALAMNSAGAFYAYVLSSSASSLVTIDPNTAVATEVAGGVLQGRDIRGAMFDASNRLFVLDASANELLQINPSNGSIVGSPLGLTVGSSPYDVNSGTDLAIRSDGSVRFVSYNEFYALDLSTGVLTHEFTDTADQYDGANETFNPGIAFSTAGGTEAYVYDAQQNDDIYTFDTGAGYTRTLLYANFIAGFNAGRGDLAAAPVPEPATLVTLGSAFVLTAVKRRRKRRLG